MRTHFRLFILLAHGVIPLFTICLFVSACSSCKQTEPRQNAVAAQGPIIRLSFGSGGGFTGAFGGYTLQSDGVVRNWTRMPGGKDSTLQTITISKTTADSLLTVFRRSDFFADSLRQYGNWTRFMRYESPDIIHYWSWVTVDKESGPAFEAQAMHERLIQYFSALFPQSTHESIHR